MTFAATTSDPGYAIFGRNQRVNGLNLSSLSHDRYRLYIEIEHISQCIRVLQLEHNTLLIASMHLISISVDRQHHI